MADDTPITPLNFNAGIVGKTLSDKKMGLDILLGYCSGLPLELSDLLDFNGGLSIALMERGMGQRELDNACQALLGECRADKLNILVTKGDLPFDKRWFIIGDIGALLALARRDRITLPFSKFLYDDLTDYFS